MLFQHRDCGSDAYPTGDFSRKREPILILSVLPYDALFFASLSDQGICFIEIFAAYDRIVVLRYKICFNLAMIVVTAKSIIRISLLK